MKINWSLIESANPWWFAEDFWEKDRYLKRLRESKVLWIPNVFSREDIKPSSLYSLRGPRQVGKTTFLKALIADLIREGTKPDSVIYIPCDLFSSYVELISFIEKVLKRKKPYLIVLDEITSVDDWPRALKVLRDVGILDNSCVIVCGSHSLDLLRGFESLFGRRGGELPWDRELLPMTFKDFLKFYNKKLYEEYLKSRPKPKLEKAEEFSEALEHIADELSEALKEYLIVGGFPRVVDEFLKTGRVSLATISDFVTYVSRDASKFIRREEVLRGIISELLKTMGAPVSWEKIARAVGTTNITVQEHVELLRRLYIVGIVQMYDPNMKRGNPRRNKKVYFLDPFIFLAARAWVQGYPAMAQFVDVWDNFMKALSDPMYSDMHFGRMLEAVFFMHLIRISPVYFWRKNNHEVDFVAPRLGIAIEVKKGRRGKPPLVPSVKRTLVVGKRIKPAHLLLLLSELAENSKLSFLL